MGGLEALLEFVGELVEAHRSLSLLLAASLGPLDLEGGSTSSLAGDGGLGLSLAELLGSRVDSLHSGLVGERVLLALGGLVSVDTLHAELALNLVGVDDSGEVSAGHDASAELEAALLGSSFTVGAENAVKLLEGVLGEDNESAEVTTRGELEQVESADGASVDTSDVASGLLDERVLIAVDDQRTLGAGETTASHLTLTGAGSLSATGEIIKGTDVVEALQEGGGLLLVERVNNERKLGHVVDLVAAGHYKRSAGSGGESRSNSVSLLVSVHLSVPLSPELERGEHAALAALVTEGTLTRAVSTRARNSGNTGDGATSTPRLGGVLVAGMPEDGATLASVLSHVGVAELDEIVSDGSSEDSGHAGRAGNLITIGRVDADGRA